MSQDQKEQLKQVLVVNGSSIFHFKDRNSVTGEQTRNPVCGVHAKNVEDHEIDEMHIQEAKRRGKRPCKECVRWVGSVYDVSVKECHICNKLNLTSDDAFAPVELKKASAPNEIVNICESCVDKLNESL